MTFPTLRTYARSLTLVPAALVFHLGAAAAANSPDSLLLQQRELLAGTTAPVTAQPHGQPAVKALRSAGDAQDFARRLLLGAAVRTPGRQPASASRAPGHWDYGDAQQHLQRVLLGRRDAPAAGS